MYIHKNIIYWYYYEKVSPINTHRITGSYPEGVEEYAFLMKEFEIKQNIIGDIYALVSQIMFPLQEYSE